MAALLENVQVEDPRAAGMGVANSDPVTTMIYGDAATPNRYAGGSSIADAIKSRMPDLVKGAGMRGKGGNMPLTNHTDIMTRAAQATVDVRTETYKGFRAKRQVIGELNQGWLDHFGALKTALCQMSPKDYIDELAMHMAGGAEAIKAVANKSFTAGNLGIGSVSGLTPFNLYAPSRLIYPVD